MSKFLLLFVFLVSLNLESYGFADSSSVIKKRGINKFRLGVVVTGTAVFGWVTYDYFNNVWWKQTKVKKFTLRDDWNDLIRADKFGHFYFSYLLSDVYKSIFKWVGFNSKTSSFLGAGISILYEVGVVELTDGFTTRWGFSPSDVVSNVCGALFPVAQEYIPSLQVVTFKLSYTPSGYTWLDYLRVGSLRDALYKKQFHTDYEGMTFWVSLELKRLLPSRLGKFIPSFLNLAVGYSVKDINYAGRGYSEIYIALDYNLLKVDTGSDILNRIIRTLNYIHFPAPTLKIKPYVKFYYLYF